MARCKNCHRKGFMVETDVSGLCSDCSPYYYLILPDDLKALENSLHILGRIDNAAAALGRLEAARDCLQRIRPYAEAGLVRLPMSLTELDNQLDLWTRHWQES
jgi:hypothetical protein